MGNADCYCCRSHGKRVSLQFANVSLRVAEAAGMLDGEAAAAWDAVLLGAPKAAREMSVSVGPL